ncbi:hypothetical protein BKA65DRAFT_271667 [Rhexocercosporidium sp. MPI-PUGE-AT-0058]|nr:hypothetical protein BKA65DRAFT_271667 [Rhexocercosporidium sp. MPI-PUGE-AT-0058]
MARLNSGVGVKAAAAPRRPKTYGRKRTILAEMDSNQRIMWQKIKDAEKKEKAMAKKKKEIEQDDEVEQTKERRVDAGDDRMEHGGDSGGEAEEESVGQGRTDEDMEGLEAGDVEADDFNVMRSAGGKAEKANLQARNDGENGGLETRHVEAEDVSMDQGHGSVSNDQGNITGCQDTEVERLEAQVVEADDINMDQDGGSEEEQQEIVSGLEDNENERLEAHDAEATDASANQDATEEETEQSIIKYIVATEMRRTKESYPKTLLHALIQWEGYDDTSDMTWEVMPNAVVNWKPYYKHVWADKEYVMTMVWASRKTPKGKEYLVEWDGYPSVKDLTWEPEEVVRTTFAEGLQAYLTQKTLD